MAFYVKLGPRGFVFRFGTILIGILGSCVYWRASRRRGMTADRELMPVLVDKSGEWGKTFR